MFITDGASLAQTEGAKRIAAAVCGGVGVVQLRDRGADPGELLDRAQRLRALLPGTLLVVNDRVDVALGAGTAGVQLGAGALRAAEARRLVGREALIGCSVHSVEEAIAAAAEGADYLVVGTIYPTSTHPDKVPEGLVLLKAVAAAVRLPLFAIGGVISDNAGTCIRHGAHGVAVISAIGEAPDPELAARRLLTAVEEAVREREHRLRPARGESV